MRQWNIYAHTHTHTPMRRICVRVSLFVFVFARASPVLCKYKPTTVERGWAGFQGAGEHWLTGPASCLINRQFAKVDTCMARIILGHTWAPVRTSFRIRSPPKAFGLDPEWSNRSSGAPPSALLCGCILWLWTLAWWVYLCVPGIECVLSWLVWLMKRHLPIEGWF